MTTGARELLWQLLGYVAEQIKDIDPRGFQLSKDAGFGCGPADIRGLPGVEMDIRVEGDHIWMRVSRLEATRPPKPSDWAVDLFRISDNPSGVAPAIDEAALQRRINGATANQPPQQHEETIANLRSRSDEALRQYRQLWEAWAEGEKPRRKTISLYRDLFALKHQVEAEETAKPTEVVWGIGIATWDLSFDGSSFPFEYPIYSLRVFSPASLVERERSVEDVESPTSGRRFSNIMA